MGDLDISVRQQELLLLLLSISEPISLLELAKSVHVNIRTVQRDLNTIEKFLKNFQVSLWKKKGTGVQLIGSQHDMEQLKNAISDAPAVSSYTPDQRQQGLIRDLLLAKEPVKLFVLSRKYGVTEATISHDLDKVDQWFAKYAVEVIRKPGLGVYLQGTERNLRTAASYILLQDIRIEEWLELFSWSKKSGEQKPETINLQEVIQSHLMEFVQVSNIFYVEKAVQEALAKQAEITLTDREYVSLVIHLTLAVERIKQGNFLEKEAAAVPLSKGAREYELAQQIAKVLEQYLHVTLPIVEIGYIAIHLRGAMHSRAVPDFEQDASRLLWMNATKQFVYTVEQRLQERLSDDEFLIEGLIAHFTTSIKRLELGLSIYNPMLDQIRANYPVVFEACEHAAAAMAKRFGKQLPVTEIGYLTMHIGAAIIRKKNKTAKQYRVVVVCASGIGTSRFLASRLRKEFSNIQIDDIISANELQVWLDSHHAVDMIISTVALSHVQTVPVIQVTPFLDQKDMEAMTSMFDNLSNGYKSKHETSQTSAPEMLAMARYGEAMLQILRHFFVQESVQVKPDEVPVQLHEIVKTIETHPAVQNYHRLLADLAEREQKGIFVLDELAMIHAKTAGVKELLVAVFRFPEVVLWGVNEETQPVRTFLLLAAPAGIPQEQIKMISEISAALIDDSFLAALHSSDPDDLKKKLEDILSNSYLEKTSILLKGHHGNE
ncbi:PRD domain-containing protein [Fodinisporobacter ferrooxydans]|uniref:PRD domain-containing protein n=1 Tax=Fodinisporobacter ferrooxydans TaxID=2901836 RepID=A0ABY4CKZ9_9BACL|nr:PRD domain-containing protein [Alicyclobacillaceae bacterium MYW30-H2]